MNIIVNTKQKKYNVVIKKSLLDDIDKYFLFDYKNNKVLLITDNNIPNEYINKVKNKINKFYIFTIKNGEKSKNINNYKDILKYLVKNNFTRKDLIIALGGGVVGDLAGFVASTYMRGIRFYNIPTTVLSMVDSSIGGKTAIDFLNIKNIVGSFYQPEAVFIDVNCLKTLSNRHFVNGLVEAIKMSVTFDRQLFDFIKLSSNIKDDIEKVIEKSIRLKKYIVEKDEKENNLRKTLNFGHTIGHAIEESCKNKLLHGECVGLGMLYFSSNKVKNEIRNVLIKYNLPMEYRINKKIIVELLKHDKKMNGDYLDIVYVKEIGKCEIKKYSFDRVVGLL